MDEDEMDPLSFMAFDSLRSRERSMARASKARAAQKDAQSQRQQARKSTGTATFNLDDK